MKLTVVVLAAVVMAAVVSNVTAAPPPSLDGLTFDQAVSRAAGPMTHAQDGHATPEQTGNMANISTVCWTYGNNGEMWTEWGLWPVWQRVYEVRRWCADGYGGKQTYRQTTVNTSSPLCDASNSYQQLIAGGNGTGHSRVRTGATFTCPTPVPWINTHHNDWQEWNCTTYGDCYWKAAS